MEDKLAQAVIGFGLLAEAINSQQKSRSETPNEKQNSVDTLLKWMNHN